MATLTADGWVVDELVAPGSTVDIAGMTTAASAASQPEKDDFLNAVGAAQYLSVRDEVGDFTLTATNHANRRTDANKGTAIAVTWATGHGMTKGDCGRIVQTGAGAVTITAGSGTLTLAPNVAAASTTADGSWLDWEYVGGDELLITGRGSAITSTVPTVTAYSDGLGTQAFAAPGTSEFTLSSITIPANKIGANGWVEFFFSAERTATDALTTRIRVGNATTGTSLTNITAGARIVGFAAFVSQGSTSSHRSWAPDTTGAATGNAVTVTDTTATTSNITFYFTGQLASPGSTTVTRYYFKAKVFNPDAA